MNLCVCCLAPKAPNVFPKHHNTENSSFIPRSSTVMDRRAQLNQTGFNRKNADQNYFSTNSVSHPSSSALPELSLPACRPPGTAKSLKPGQAHTDTAIR